MKTLPCILLALLLFAGCTSGSRIDRTLDRAGALMMEQPDSALAILASIDASSLSDARRARHALYTICSRDKLGENVDSTFDTILNEINPDLEHNLSDKDELLSFYYKGLRNLNCRNFEEAIIDFLSAEEIGMLLDENVQLGLIYRALADAYLGLYNHNSAAAYSELSFRKFEEADAKKYIPYAIADLAIFYNNAARYDDAIATARQARRESKDVKDSVLLANIISVEGMAYVGKGDYPMAKHTLMELVDSGIGFSAPCDIRNIGLGYLREGNMEKARLYDSYLEEMDSTDKILKYYILKEKGDYKTALALFETEYYALNDILRKSTRQNSDIRLTEFYKSQREIEEMLHLQEVKNAYLFLVIFGMTALLFALLLIAQRQYYLRRRTKLLMEIQILKEGLFDYEKRSEEIKKEFESNMCIAEEKILGLQNSIRRVFASQSYYLNEISRSYYECKGLPIEMKKIYNRSISFINDLRNDAKTLSELENAINLNLENLIIDLRIDYPALSDSEVRLYIYLVAGISSQAIGVILSKPVQNIYLRKSRLIGKLQKLDEDKAARYIAFI